MPTQFSRYIVPLAVLAMALDPGIAGGQQPTVCPKAQPGHIIVYGDVTSELAIPVADLRAMPRAEVEAVLRDSTQSRFGGVTLRGLLSLAGVPDDLEKDEFTRYVVVEAADGYRTLFSLVELDPVPGRQPPIVADTENGGAVRAESGPLQLIAPEDSHHSRWVRQVVCLWVDRDRGPR